MLMANPYIIHISKEMEKMKWPSRSSENEIVYFVTYVCHIM